jgi:hypothetical protein
MSALLTEPIAVLENEVLALRDFREADPEVTDWLSRQEDLTEGVHRCLQMGARALSCTQARVDTQEVQLAFDQLRHDFGSQVDQAHGQLRQTLIAAIGSDDAYLQRTMAEFRRQLGEQLHDTFDPASRESVLGLVQGLLDRSQREHLDSLRRMLDSADPDSPFERQRLEVMRAVADQGQLIQRSVAELSQKLALSCVRSDMMELTPAKGVSYEALVHEALSAITAAQGDLAGRTGTETGDDGAKVGDEVVVLNPEDSHGRELRYVLEVKDRPMSMAAIQAELDRALTNRRAGAAIAVFSSQAGCPGGQAFQWSGNKALVVFDKEHPDPSPLLLATAWARWVVCRDLVAAKEGVDLAAAEAAIKDAARALDRVSTIRRCHATAAKKISEAGDQVSGLHAEIQDALARLGEVLSCA